MLIILILFCLISVVAILKRIIKNKKHLDEYDFIKFMSNRLSQTNRNRFTAHLGLCEKCQKRFNDYNFGKSKKAT